MLAVLCGRLIPLLLMAVLSWASTAQSQQSGTRYSAGAAGKKAFVANCSGCHGLDGSGGDRAPTIAAGSDAARLSDAELMRVVSKGIAGAGMPPFGSLGARQITSVVGYLRTLQGAGKSVGLPGNPQRGATLFFGKARCSECHMANGKGGFIASDLSDYGSGRTPAKIRESLVAPQKDPDQNAKQAVVMTRGGRRYKGVVRVEDNFSLVLQTTAGEFVSVQKSELANILYDARSLMPDDYGSTLTSGELDDLVSYLMSLPQRGDSAASKKTQGHHREDED